MARSPEPLPQFEMLTINEGVGFAVGAAGGSGIGLLVYASRPAPSAGADQKIAAWQGQVHDTEQGLAGLAGVSMAEQRPAGKILLRSLNSAETHLQTAIAQRPASPDTAASETGTVIEGMVGTGLVLAALVMAVRGLRHVRHTKKARAFEQEVSEGLSQLPVDTPPRHRPGS